MPPRMYRPRRRGQAEYVEEAGDVVYHAARLMRKGVVDCERFDIAPSIFLWDVENNALPAEFDKAKFSERLREFLVAFGFHGRYSVLVIGSVPDRIPLEMMNLIDNDPCFEPPLFAGNTEQDAADKRLHQYVMDDIIPIGRELRNIFVLSGDHFFVPTLIELRKHPRFTVTLITPSEASTSSDLRTYMFNFRCNLKFMIGMDGSLENIVDRDERPRVKPPRGNRSRVRRPTHVTVSNIPSDVKISEYGRLFRIFLNPSEPFKSVKGFLTINKALFQCHDPEDVPWVCQHNGKTLFGNVVEVVPFDPNETIKLLDENNLDENNLDEQQSKKIRVANIPTYMLDELLPALTKFLGVPFVSLKICWTPTGEFSGNVELLLSSLWLTFFL